MTPPEDILLIQAIRQPEKTLSFKLDGWDILIRQARSAGVLTRLGLLLSEHHLLNKIPQQPLNHLKSAIVYFEQFEYTVAWEIKQIQEVLNKQNIPFVLLKGAAYHQAKNKAGAGRVFSDIDILVKREQLGEVEKVFLTSGWLFDKTNSYDQDYYRKWMHELPPLRHFKRGTSLDIHHNLVPLTSKVCPDVKKLWMQAETVKGGILVLSPADRVIHSAVHLFYDGEYEHGFRDISDIDLLLREFSKDEKFWKSLISRSTELGLKEPVCYALRYCYYFLKTPVPKDVLNLVVKQHGEIRWAIMDFLFKRALLPNHSTCQDRWNDFAIFVLYIRGHLLRMPLYLLIPHLLRKGWMRLSGKAGH